jgi:hypothetical protein
MAQQVKVTSIDALESFRASLIVFLTKSRRSLDEVGDDVRRTRLWLQNDQRLHWENEVRRRRRTLDQAQQELLSARLSALRETATIQKAAVQKAKHALVEAEEKLQNVKLWNRDFDGCVDPLTKRLQGIREFLDHDMPKAITFLVQSLRSLDAYAETYGEPAAIAPSSEAPQTVE